VGPRFLVVVASCAALACGAAAGPRAQPGPSSVLAAPRHRAGCPSADFAAFLTAFAESTALQEAFTRFPLAKRSVVDADPEPRQVEALLSRADVTFPVFPSEARRAVQGLASRVEQDGPARRSVVVAKPDTDYQISFVFEKSDCWQLVLVDDQSL
jgi:hypothetical protein